MVHAVHRSIQVYQDFHRQTLSHLQQLEQDCYKLMPQFDLEQVLSMVERAHQIKAGARYLNLSGFEQFAHHLKGRYLALTNLSMTFERDLLKQMIQMQELFRLCLLSNISTWKADLTNVVTKLPDVFQSVDGFLNPHQQYRQHLPSQAYLEIDIQRLLVSIVLIPELARLDMMLKNTPSSKLSEILVGQLPRLQGLAQQLNLDEIQRSMQIALLEIQARPSHAKTIGTQSLLKWSDLCYQTLTNSNKPLPLRQTETESSTVKDLYVSELEAHLVDLSVELIEGNEDQLIPSIQGHAQHILTLAEKFEVSSLAETTNVVLASLRYHPENASLIGRLGIQDWLRYQLDGSGHVTDTEHPNPNLLTEGVPSHTSETLRELAKIPVNWNASNDLQGSDNAWENAPDPDYLNLLNQVEMPDGFQPFSATDDIDTTPTITITRQDLDQLSGAIQACQAELEQVPSLPKLLKQTFQHLLDSHHRLATLPLALIFNRFQSLVDALGLQSHKELNLKLSGGQIAIDQQKADLLYELIVPLISNTVIHGIEKSDERQRLGKSRQGRISLSAFIQSDGVLLIELQDDGRGLNFEVLREWVIRQYDMSTQDGYFLTEAEILDYVFRREHPDSSGSNSIEEICLGSVQGTLDQLNGSIGVSTIMTQGTTFRITLPNLILDEPKLKLNQVSGTSSVREGTIAPVASPYPTVSMDYSLDALRLQETSGPTLTLGTAGLFIWADQTAVFVLECDRIEEYVMPHVTEAHQRLNSLSWRDQSIPIFSLHDFLGQTASDSAGMEEDVILMLKGEQQFLALRAPMQHLVNTATLKINHLSQALAAPRYIYGTTVIDDEAPRLVIDVAALIAQQPLQTLFPLPDQSAQSHEVAPASPTHLADLTPQSTQPTILVVDDSRTAREIVSMTLRKGGYEILHAKDGIDALEQLQGKQTKPCRVDLVISDVAMPRMNGLEFLRQCRQDATLKSLPIAMLSNCDSTTHSDLALKEGADAYLTKPYDEEVFLTEIATLLKKIPQAAGS